MEVATDEYTRSSCFTSYVDANAVSWKSDIFVRSQLPSSDELKVLAKFPKEKKKVKNLVRSSDWPMNHEVRRSLWVTLCSTIDSFTAASDGSNYHGTVQEIFGERMLLFIAVFLIFMLDVCFVKAN